MVDTNHSAAFSRQLKLCDCMIMFSARAALALALIGLAVPHVTVHPRIGRNPTWPVVSPAAIWRSKRFLSPPLQVKDSPVIFFIERTLPARKSAFDPTVNEG